MSPRNAGGGTRNAQSGTAGVIPVNPAALQTSAAKSNIRLKVVVRRLPPALTRAEFEQALGEEWMVGAGKVDWIEYRQGKVRGPGKTPEQSRAYLHLAAEAYLQALEAQFLSVAFHDAKGTYRHPELKHLPPALEFSPCQRVPPARSCQDNRQGLIDQDPEYMAFLEGETQVLPKPPSLDATVADRPKGTVTSTPLIEALREKKAAKAKVAAAKAATKRPEEVASPSKSKTTAAGKGSKAATIEPKSAAKAEAKNKEGARSSTKDSKPAPADKAPTGPAANASQSTKPKRERAPASIKSMLERDLGINQPQRRARNASASATENTKAAAANGAATSSSEQVGTSNKGNRASRKEKDSAVTTPAVNSPKTSPAPQPSPRVPPKSKSPLVTVTDKPATASKPSPLAVVNNVSKQAKSAPKPNASSTKAYLKHANASQGITDELLRKALNQFGEVVSLDIDKRKGTALAEFKSNDGLAAAMAKRNIPVAQGAVEVLEYRDRPKAADKPAGAPSRPSARGTRGRGGRAGNSERPPVNGVPAVNSGAG